ncbi:HD domain-containing protein [Lachnospiraceae bacterium C1.1]|nr:HD domain-containing protein [Lachnospiraceae bacterium C1.1]
MGQVIRSEDVCQLIVGTLKLIDSKVMGHSCRTAFMVYAMLKASGKYEDFELAEITFVVALHDIGAYRVEQGVESLQYEFEEPLPHSIYGYLFMKSLTPYEQLSKIILYSHVDHTKLKNINFQYKNVANILNLAGMIEHFRSIKGKKFNTNNLRRYIGSKFSELPFNLLDIAARRYDMFEMLDSGEYLDELYESFKKVMFADEDKEKMLELLVYIMALSESRRAGEAIICMDVAEQIARRLDGITEEDIEKLHYAGLLHDIGLSKVPKELRNPANLKEESDIKKFCRHLETADDLLRNRIDPEICDIIARHHERIDGSGIPNQMEAPDMTMNDKILQLSERIADIAMSGNVDSVKPAATIAAIVTNEMDHNKFQRKIVMAFCGDKEEIMEHAVTRRDEIMADFEKINLQYKQLSSAMGVTKT